MASNSTLSQHIQESPIDVLDLSTRAINALQKAGIDTVGDLVGLSDLRSIKGIGKVSTAEIRGKLRDFADVCVEGSDDDLLRLPIIKSAANLLSSLVPLIQKILNAIQKPRYFEILRLHYGLQDYESKT
jgi:hypothetical protein